jgi:hypothetical protein
VHLIGGLSNPDWEARRRLVAKLSGVFALAVPEGFTAEE